MEQPITPAPAAPAQPAPAAPQTTTQSAVHAAVASNDTGAYRAARRAERAGKPLAEVATPAPEAKTTEIATPEVKVDAPDPAAPAQPADPLKPSRKEREQTEINERVRRAVEAATADFRAEIDRLKTGAPRAEVKPDAKPEPMAKFQTLAEWTAQNPEGTLEGYMDARDEWRDSQRQTAETEKTVGEALEADATRVIESFDARVVEAEKTDPKIRAKITPLAQALGARGGPFGVVARVAAVADKGPQVLAHLADHPEVLKSLITLPERLRGLPLQVQVEQHKQHIAREIGRLEASLTPSASAAEPIQPKTLTDAPEAPQTLGRRPADAADPKVAAIRSGDTRAYRKLRQAERAAGRR